MSAPTFTSRRSSKREGFTLLELMISLGILSIVVIGVFESLTRQHRTSIVTESVVEVQNNVRAIASLIEREVRMGGYMVPDAVALCGLDSTTGGDELFISESEPMVPDDARAGDMGARLAAGGGAFGNPTIGAAVTYNLDSTTSDLDSDGTLFYDNDGNGTPEADFRVDGGFILADMANPHRGTICGRVDGASTTALDLVPMAGALDVLVGTDAEEEIVIVPAARYAISTVAGREMRLERNGDLLAQGVDDFQVAYFFDEDDDGVVDDEEQPGSKDDAAYDPADRDHSDLKEVRFSIRVRTRAADQEFVSGALTQLENRPPAGGNDGFRRRDVTGSVRPRNVGNSGSI
jgi:prepilin-type N-terminal cleavage/methylation domain-containing protein